VRSIKNNTVVGRHSRAARVSSSILLRSRVAPRQLTRGVSDL
jgi:hypothetical protein